MHPFNLTHLRPVLSVSNVTFGYTCNGKPLLDNVSFDVFPGQLVFITGSSGVGKTSLLRLIYRAASPQSGRIYLDGQPIISKPVPWLRRQLGIVFQDSRLLRNKTVLENVTLAGEIAGESPRALRNRALEVLEQVGLAGKAHRRPQQLSAGERQRVAIARALVNRPRLLLADEPTGNLDPDTARHIFDLLHNLIQSGPTACLAATHELSLVDEYPARILHLKQGRLEELSGGRPRL